MVKRALDVLTKLPRHKRQRVFQLLSLLQEAECAEVSEESEEIKQAIAEIVVKSRIAVPRQAATGELEDGISESAKETVAAYHHRIGDAIRKRREELKMTQQQLSEKCGLPQSHICRLEVGKHAPTRITIERLGEALGLSPNQIDPLYDN